WALAGLGIVERSEWDVAPLLASGKLVRLLPGWHLPPAPVTALLPSRTGRSARQRVFLEAARQFLDPPPWRANAGAAPRVRALRLIKSHLMVD
ncbi:LysR substrate-binding domain-containing protein, partial [Pantoea agglomerans]|uniref:LysR substrate-binding domain-containing protein n=1 Tax=Enterobacter agglomerans TaxID=549 RepID=UPI001F5C0619